MKRSILYMVVALIIFSLCACGHNALPTETTHFSDTVPLVTTEPKPTELKPTEPKPTESKATEPVATAPLHSPLYIPEVSVEDVIRYFNEVCLDSEFVHGGDPSYVQKWVEPVYYTLEGSYTDADIAVFNKFVDYLNDLEGFPGISQTQDPVKQNLRICFVNAQEMVSLMGSDYSYMDGAVRFWYVDNKIIDAIICYRTEINQYTRNSVILEEIYNGLGPVQDTGLRTDSLIYQGYSEPQWLTPVDELILKLLYHPDIQVGMNAAQCEEVIRRLYY